MVVIKWTNRYSKETGYVESVCSKEQHFCNTYDIEKAKRYSLNSAKGILTKLVKYGEADNNEFEFITV